MCELLEREMNKAAAREHWLEKGFDKIMSFDEYFTRLTKYTVISEENKPVDEWNRGHAHKL